MSIKNSRRRAWSVHMLNASQKHRESIGRCNVNIANRKQDEGERSGARAHRTETKPAIVQGCSAVWEGLKEEISKCHEEVWGDECLTIMMLVQCIYICVCVCIIYDIYIRLSKLVNVYTLKYALLQAKHSSGAVFEEDRKWTTVKERHRGVFSITHLYNATSKIGFRK